MPRTIGCVFQSAFGQKDRSRGGDFDEQRDQRDEVQAQDAAGDHEAVVHHMLDQSVRRHQQTVCQKNRGQAATVADPLLAAGQPIAAGDDQDARKSSDMGPDK